MAELKVMGEYVGPGERKAAERLAERLPSDWVVFAGRKLAGETRDDVDLIVVGAGTIFVLEEKSWGPRIVVGDNFWHVNGEARPNPLNRNAQLARKLAGLFKDKARGYANVRGKRVVPAVVLSHDNVTVMGAANHDASEHIWSLEQADEAMLSIDRRETPLGDARRTVLAYLDELPQARKDTRIGDYRVLGRVEVPGAELTYYAVGNDGQHVLLKCYPLHRLESHGDPREFLRRETIALNRLADYARTWHARPFFEDPARGLFVVPVVPPAEARSLEQAIVKPGPERSDGELDDDVARDVARDAFLALADVHAQGLIHRALHPRRVWLARRMRVMFSDFHFARVTDGATIAGWARDYDVSENYRAPECVADLSSATAKSDVYSLALCLSAWLLGRDVTELAPDALAAQVRAGYPWAAALVDGLATSPTARPTAEEVVESLSPEPVVVEPVTEPDAEFVVGQTIDGRYEIKRQLGRGGYATSWLVYDREADHTKVLKQFMHGDPDELRAEYNAANTLQHDGCGRVYDVRVGREPYYLVSEYVEGESLATGGIDRDVDELRSIAVGVLEALEYIHRKGFVHGDVTPANVIVSTDGNGYAKLIDFGLAMKKGGTPAGWSPRFAAPEVIERRSAVVASDIFSFAATMAFAMLGRHVAAYEDRELVVVEPTPDELATWQESGERLLRVLMRGVSNDPTARPESAAAFRSLVIESQQPPSVAVPAPGVALVRQTNPTVEAVRRLYRGSTIGNAGNRGLDDEFAKRTYVPTRLDTELLPRVLAGDFELVLLSGNPGDGKTSVLVQLGDELRRRGGVSTYDDDAGWAIDLAGHTFIAVYDASESHEGLSSDDLIRRALDPVLGRSDATALIAVNDGRLHNFLRDFDGVYEDWALAVRDQLDGLAPEDDRVVLVDLKRRTLTSANPVEPGLGRRVLEQLVRDDLWTSCVSCVAQAECPILANRNTLAGRGAEVFDELLGISHLRRRRRATFRDVRSAAAWLITGDRSCEAVHVRREEGLSPLYLPDALTHDLAFAQGSGDYLVDEWSDLDPKLVAAPAVDRTRREMRRDPARRYLQSVDSVARALYWGVVSSDEARPSEMRVYRHLSEFKAMLAGDLPQKTIRDRLLLGISRLVGAFGYNDEGLAVSTGADSAWTVLHSLPADQFQVEVTGRNDRFIESMPDRLAIVHPIARLSLSLDTAEIILRVADGEIVDDVASDGVRQEIDGFVSQLARQPSRRARIVDASGSVASVRAEGPNILLEPV
ncbi:protein kinase domain-containing protein [Cellulomonas sp. ICMP 17802]|uniref:protein kinase domain-containing protein n=1 Tax=Cellulomonas sp. ICMP 17802 TaxID=3239199 RepID=UPI00351AEEF4